MKRSCTSLKNTLEQLWCTEHVSIVIENGIDFNCKRPTLCGFLIFREEWRQSERYWIYFTSTVISKGCWQRKTSGYIGFRVQIPDLHCKTRGVRKKLNSMERAMAPSRTEPITDNPFSPLPMENFRTQTTRLYRTLTFIFRHGDFCTSGTANDDEIVLQNLQKLTAIFACVLGTRRKLHRPRCIVGNFAGNCAKA